MHCSARQHIGPPSAPPPQRQRRLPSGATARPMAQMCRSRAARLGLSHRQAGISMLIDQTSGALSRSRNPRMQRHIGQQRSSTSRQHLPGLEELLQARQCSRSGSLRHLSSQLHICRRSPRRHCSEENTVNGRTNLGLPRRSRSATRKTSHRRRCHRRVQSQRRGWMPCGRKRSAMLLPWTAMRALPCASSRTGCC